MLQKKPMSDVELTAFEAGQDFEALLGQSAREMRAGNARSVSSPVVVVRKKTKSSQPDKRVEDVDHHHRKDGYGVD
ncbi:hypothetical protein [Variovorax sp. GB1P17]|uniref:hypothetical protein n=1 Tax=Variovorax sp. GB1P17 TaxID=3443740 RepID=UPI003F46A691